MPAEARLLVGLTVAMAVVYRATPLAIRVADHLQFYDRPMGYKGHGRPTPYLGGAAVMAGFVLALLTVTTGEWRRTLPLIGGMAVLWVVGTVDDRHNVAPRWRVAVELLLAGMLWKLGLGWDLGVGGAVDLALTLVWVVAVVNVFNLFDNMDGAASTMALAVSAGVLVMGLVHDDMWLAVAAATLCGACLGFLPHNLASPARIFLGDGGSMPIGFAVATLVMTGSAEAVSAWQALVVGLLLVGIPALDTTLVMVSRRRRGISIVTGGRDHLTHRTQRYLRNARAVAMALGAVQALVSALALFAISGGASAIVLIIVLYLVAASTAIAILDAGQREEAVLEGVGTSRPRAMRTRGTTAVGLAVAAVFGLAFGASAFFSGFYNSSMWVPVGLGLLMVATAGAIARPPRLSRSAVLVLGGLIGISVWALVSSLWAPSIVQATTDGNRYFVLAAIVASGLVLVRSDRAAAWLTGALAAGVGVVAVVVLVRMLGSSPNAVFIAGRLDKPLGYINGEATVFIMGFWLCFSLAERTKPWLAGMSSGAATLMACLAFLSQSRGAALATIISIAVVVGVVPGSRVRRIFGLAISGAAVVLAYRAAMQDVYDAGLAGAVPAELGHRAAVAMLVAAVGAGTVWGVAVFLHERLSSRAPVIGTRLHRAGLISLATLAIAVGVAGLASAPAIGNRVSDQWNAFVHLSAKPGSEPVAVTTSRLASGAGNRYDYWRVAWDAFAARPVGGVGAGNYERSYFEARRTSEDVTQPHSIEFQTLSELGGVGGLLLAAVIAGLGIAVWQMRRAAAASARTASLMIAATGVVTAWLIHTSVDWIHLLPGVTGIALAMVAVLLFDRRPSPAASHAPLARPERRFSRRPLPLAAAGVAGLCVVVATTSLSRQGLADYFRNRAEESLARHPLNAIREANRSLRLDAENPQTYYVKAAALARFNAAGLSRQTLLRAAAKEPDNFVTWTLLGDLAVRRGLIGEARHNYSRASKLNTRDQSLRQLARDPRLALQRTGP